MLDPHVRTSLPPKSGKGNEGTYETTFRVPDRHGVFKFVIDWKRKGYVYPLLTYNCAIVIDEMVSQRVADGRTCIARPSSPLFPRGMTSTHGSSPQHGPITRAPLARASRSSCSRRCGSLGTTRRRRRPRRPSEKDTSQDAWAWVMAVVTGRNSWLLRATSDRWADTQLSWSLSGRTQKLVSARFATVNSRRTKMQRGHAASCYPCCRPTSQPDRICSACFVCYFIPLGSLHHSDVL